MLEMSMIISFLCVGLLGALSSLSTSNEVAVRLASCAVAQTEDIVIGEGGNLNAVQPRNPEETDPSEMSCQQLVDNYGGGTWGIRGTPLP